MPNMGAGNNAYKITTQNVNAEIRVFFFGSGNGNKVCSFVAYFRSSNGLVFIHSFTSDPTPVISVDETDPNSCLIKMDTYYGGVMISNNQISISATSIS